MARRVARGDIWMFELRPPDKTRPVLVLTRDEVIPLLERVMVAPITSTVRGLPSEVLVGPEDGLKHTSAINLDHVSTVPRAQLRTWLGHLDAARMKRVCEALAIAVACEG